MAVNLSPYGGVGAQFLDNAGNVLTGGKIFTYAAGTTTNQATYTSSAGNIFHPNPIILDASGRVPSGGEIWLTDGLLYKFVLTDSNDVLIATYDNISGINSNFVNFVNQQEIQTATAGQTVFNLATVNYTPGTNSLSVFVDGVNQYGPGAQYAYLETDSDTVTFVNGLHVGALVKFTTSQLSSSAGGDAFNISYLPPFTGATGTNVGAKLAQTVSVKDFGAVGDSITDDTAALQDAIDSGQSLFFPDGEYLCNNLTQSTNGQYFYANGDVKLIKNANGPIITSSGNFVVFENIKFYGDSATPVFTGNNFVSSGSNLSLINCGSQWAFGRAVLATGSHVQIIGSNTIYQTVDTSATGFDIEIGVSGTATLYHQLFGVYTSQATGGIKFIDCGSQSLVGGQIGKLYIARGTGPVGSNGGMTSNMRIIGDVTIELSSAIFTCNQFNSVGTDVTFALGTSGGSIDISNTTAASYTNNGNANNFIMRNTSAGGTVDFSFGATGPAFQVNATNGDFTLPSRLYAANNLGIRTRTFGGTDVNLAAISSGDDFSFGTDSGAGNFTTVASGSTGIFHTVAGVSVTQTISTAFRPATNNTFSLGAAGVRWTEVFAINGTINTSDEREKQQVRALSDAEKAVATKVKGLLRAFKFNDAVSKKGDKARIHFGVMAQEVAKAFESEGLNANDYGLFCYDEWNAEEAIVDSDTGQVVLPAKEAGNMYGIRYEQLLAFIIGAM
jgi:hypothetical protein